VIWITGSAMDRCYKRKHLAPERAVSANGGDAHVLQNYVRCLGIRRGAFASLCASGQAVSGERVEGHALYRPIQSISNTFGSKIASGYFIHRNSVCLVTLMIAEKTDPDLRLAIVILPTMLSAVV
jgi:hypothetical protein